MRPGGPAIGWIRRPETDVMAGILLCWEELRSKPKKTQKTFSESAPRAKRIPPGHQEDSRRATDFARATERARLPRIGPSRFLPSVSLWGHSCQNEADRVELHAADMTALPLPDECGGHLSFQRGNPQYFQSRKLIDGKRRTFEACRSVSRARLSVCVSHRSTKRSSPAPIGTVESSHRTKRRHRCRSPFSIASNTHYAFRSPRRGES